MPEWYLEDRVRDGLAMSAALLKQTLRELIASPAPRRLGTVECPTLVLWGSDDTMLGGGQLDGLHEAIRRAEVISYADTGHLVLWQRPERVAADVVAFARRTWRTSSRS